MKKTLFLTGFPGFLTSNLLQQLYEDYTDEIDHIYLLVLSSEEKVANDTLRRFAKEGNIPFQKCTVLVGDITQANLGLHPDTLEKLAAKVTHVFHLAAIYDLAVPKHIAERVNIHGTIMVNDWLQTLSYLERYIYFSTAYVSGKREGRIYEHELDVNQTFRNHYEHTKFIAELLVDELKEKIPTTIIRPGIVKGHSKTGETIKFDGLYFMLNMYDKLSFLPFIPYLKEGGRSPEGNFVPSDYVLKATSYVAMNDIGEGKTYHLTDPNPYTMIELQKMLSQAYLGRSPMGMIPVAFIKNILAISVVRKWLQVEAEAMDYFTIHSSYDTSQITNDLAKTKIQCVDLAETVESMIEFYRKYKDDHTKHIPIN